MVTTDKIVAKLDKKGVIILIVSWVLALLFFVIGFVTLLGGEGDIQSGNTQRKEIIAGYRYSYTVETGDVLDFSFEAKAAFEYVIAIKGGDIQSIKTDNGRIVGKQKYSGYGYENYDNLYKIYTVTVQTYYIEIVAAEQGRLIIFIDE